MSFPSSYHARLDCPELCEADGVRIDGGEFLGQCGLLLPGGRARGKAVRVPLPAQFGPEKGEVIPIHVHETEK